MPTYHVLLTTFASVVVPASLTADEIPEVGWRGEIDGGAFVEVENVSTDGGGNRVVLYAQQVRRLYKVKLSRSSVNQPGFDTYETEAELREIGQEIYTLQGNRARVTLIADPLTEPIRNAPSGQDEPRWDGKIHAELI